MEHYSNQELIEMLPPQIKDSKELATKQKALLGQFIIYSGLDEYKDNGNFYRSNNDLAKDIETDQKTIISAINKLISLGYITRESGKRENHMASKYTLNMDKIYHNPLPSERVGIPVDTPVVIPVDRSDEILSALKSIELRLSKLEELMELMAGGMECRTPVDIPVVEGLDTSSYTSTDIDIDKEIEKDEDIDKDILIKSIFNNLNNKNARKGQTSRENEQNKPSSFNNTPTEELSALSANEVIEYLDYRSKFENVEIDFLEISDIGKVLTAAQRKMEAMGLSQSVMSEVCQVMEKDYQEATDRWIAFTNGDTESKIVYSDKDEMEKVDAASEYFYDCYLKNRTFKCVEEVDEYMKDLEFYVKGDYRFDGKRELANKIYERLKERMMPRRQAMYVKKVRLERQAQLHGTR